jgi:hypothetical protein
MLQQFARHKIFKTFNGQPIGPPPSPVSTTDRLLRAKLLRRDATEMFDRLGNPIRRLRVVDSEAAAAMLARRGVQILYDQAEQLTSRGIEKKTLGRMR